MGSNLGCGKWKRTAFASSNQQLGIHTFRWEILGKLNFSPKLEKILDNFYLSEEIWSMNNPKNVFPWFFHSILAWKHWSSEIEMEVKQVFKASISLNINTQQPCIHFCLIRCIIKRPFPPIHVPKSHPPSPQSTKYGPLHMYINKKLVMYFCRLKKQCHAVENLRK